MKKYQFLEHTADMKIQVFGKDLQELFVNAALGMMEYVFGDLNAKVDKVEHIKISANDIESLLVEWLSEILYLTVTNKRIYSAFTIDEFSIQKIVATVGSGKAVAHHEIKGVTFHDLKIMHNDGVYEVIIVFDV